MAESNAKNSVSSSKYYVDFKHTLPGRIDRFRGQVRRFHLVIKLGLLFCIMLFITVGLATIQIVKEINSIADAVENLNDMGLRRFLSISGAMYSKELMLYRAGTPWLD
jgi:hypothetical protein